jgi:hypothetical protein
MAHIPVNHPLRPLYRALAALAGLYVLIFGIVGVTETNNLSFFAQHNLPYVLGLRTNMAFSVLSIIAGVVIVICAVIGRNLDHYIYLAGGLVFMLVGMLMLGLMRTDANFFGFSMVNCIVSFVIGMVLFAAGLYGKTGSSAEMLTEHAHRRGPDPGHQSPLTRLANPSH